MKFQHPKIMLLLIVTLCASAMDRNAIYKEMAETFILTNLNATLCTETNAPINPDNFAYNPSEKPTYHVPRDIPSSDQKLFGKITKLASSQTTQVRLPCPYQGCESSYSFQSGLLRHLHTKHQEKYTCSSCPRNFNTRYLLFVHENRRHNQARNLCHSCRRGFFKKGELNLHLEAVHGIVRVRPATPSN